MKARTEETMPKYLLWLIACAGLAVPSLLSGSVAAQHNVALTGVVTSAEEGAMEGVLVNARKGIITITVVSDKDGRYSFPAAKLSPANMR